MSAAEVMHVDEPDELAWNDAEGRDLAHLRKVRAAGGFPVLVLTGPARGAWVTATEPPRPWPPRGAYGAR